MTAAAEIITSVGRSTSLQQIAIKFIVRKLIDQQFETVSRVSSELACVWSDPDVDGFDCQSVNLGGKFVGGTCDQK